MDGSYVCVLIVLLIILWIYTQPKRLMGKFDEMEVDGKEVNKKLLEIESQLGEILRMVKGNYKFEVRESKDKTYVVDKEIIYLVVKDYENGEFYDNNTIIHAAIHELAHIICPNNIGVNDEHSELFDIIERHLLEVSTSLGFFDPNANLDEKYPCIT